MKKSGGRNTVVPGVANNSGAANPACQDGEDKLLAQGIVEYDPYLDQHFVTARAIHGLCQSLVP